MDCHRRHIEHRSILSLSTPAVVNVYDSVQRTACIQIYYPQRMDLVKERLNPDSPF